MQNWIASARARFYRQIPAALSVSLLDVDIEPTSEELVVTLKTQALALTAEVASQVARDSFERAAGAARLVFNSSIDRLENPSVASGPDANGMYSAAISLAAGATIVQKPMEDADVSAAIAVTAAYRTLGAHEERRLRFALRWLDRTLRAQDVDDRFVSAWIGFETATWGPARHLHRARSGARRSTRRRGGRNRVSLSRRCAQSSCHRVHRKY